MKKETHICFRLASLTSWFISSSVSSRQDLRVVVGGSVTPKGLGRYGKASLAGFVRVFVVEVSEGVEGSDETEALEVELDAEDEAARFDFKRVARPP